MISEFHNFIEELEGLENVNTVDYTKKTGILGLAS